MKDREVFVVGGANSAGQAAVHLARYAARVTMLVRGQSLAESMSEGRIRRRAHVGRARSAQGHQTRYAAVGFHHGPQVTQPTR